MIGKADIIKDDLFGIERRLKTVDNGYFVVYSYRKKRFEVHHRGQKGNSLAFVVPYPKLDARTVRYALQTRRERLAKFVAETERENLQKSKIDADNAVKKVFQRMEGTL